MLNSKSESEIVELDIGGKDKLKVKKDLLCSVPGSKLEAMFSGRLEQVKNQ